MDDFAALRAWLDESLDFERAPGRWGGLGRTRRLMAALDHPERAGPVVHVAGTKGKGSVAAGVASALDAAGLRVGLYTSPHLVDLRERIRLGPTPLDEAAWLEAGREVRRAVEGCDWTDEGPPTWFERVTALALCAYRAARPDVVVLEVGLGGRLDATNVVTPAVAVITRIARDHTALLGEDPRAIAGEKAGILKPGVPAVAGPVDPAAEEVIAARAAALSAPLWLLGREVLLEELGPGDRGQRIAVTTPGARYELEPALAPGAPLQNAALAAAAVERLSRALGRPELTAGLRPGLARLRWRGRFDLLPQDGAPPLLVDGAHEEASMAALVTACQRTLGPRAVLLVGASADKPLAALAAALAPLGERAFACAAAHPRAAPPAQVAAALRAAGVPCQAVTGGAAAALPQALAAARAAGLPLVVTGSLFLAGDALAALGEDTRRAWS